MRTNQAIGTVLGLAFLAAFGYALYLAARFGVGLFDGVDREVAVVTGAAALTLLLCATLIANGLHAIARRDDLRQQRVPRAAVYDHVLRLRGIEDGYGGGQEDDPAAERRMLLHASPAVLTAYRRLRHAEEAGGDTTKEMAELVRAMRRDLGQRSPDVGVAELTELLDSAAPERRHPEAGHV